MIPYEDLCAALEAYAAEKRGDTMHGEVASAAAYEPQVDHPEEPRAVLRSQGGEEDATHAGMRPVYEDQSNELDIGDVISDEDA